MTEERTPEGFELRLRPRGAGRFFGAAFLAVWLCGWAVGEGMALWFLVAGARAVLTGEPLARGQEPLEPGPALGAAAFLLAWLTIWTIGGLAALRELANSLWAEDRIVARPDGLVITRRRGPFRSTRRFVPGEVRGVHRTRRGAALMLETGRGALELTRLGTLDERESALQALRREAGLPEGEPAVAPGAPPGWEEVLTPEGERVVVRDPRLRRQQATFVGALALGALALAAVPALGSGRSVGLVPVTLLGVVAAAGLAWGVAWLALGRMEWRVGSGRLTLRRRFRSSLREVFEARALELVSTRDSDGDEWFALEAVAAEPPPEGPRPGRRRRRRVFATMHDPAVPRRLGAWLASRADLPFTDLAGEGPGGADLEALRVQLEKSGGLGRLLGRVVSRLVERGISGTRLR